MQLIDAWLVLYFVYFDCNIRGACENVNFEVSHGAFVQNHNVLRKTCLNR